MADRSVRIVLTAAVSGFTAAMRTAQTATQDVAKSTVASARESGDAWSSVGTTMATVGGAILAVGAAALKTGISYNTLQQTSRAALTTLLGSAEAANEQMDKLNAFATTSPFAKQVFINAQRQMLGFGIEARKVVPYMDAIQNAVAAMGGSNQDIAAISEILAKIASQGKITARELMQLGIHGIDAATLIGDQMGKTGNQIREDITAGAIGATEALDALTAGMQERFGGAAANVKNTFEGAVDRVKAAWRDLASDLARPLVDPEGGGWAISWLNDIADVMRAFQDLPAPIKTTATTLGLVTGALGVLGGGIMITLPRIISVWDNLARVNVAGINAQGALRRLGPAFGIAGAAAGLAAVAFGIWMKVKADAKARVDDLTASLDEQTGAITENTRAVAFNRLEQDGIIAKAKELGINLETLVDTALDPSNEAYAKMAGRLSHVRIQLDQYNAGAEIADEKAKALIREHELLHDVLSAVGGVQGDVAASQSRWNDQAEAGLKVQDGLADATEGATEEVEEQISALRELIDAQREAAGEVRSLMEAELKWHEAVDGLAGSLDKNGKTLDITTEKGRENREALLDMEKAGWDLIESMEANGATQGEIQKAMRDTRDRFVEAARSMGATQEEAEALADSLNLIPTGVTTRITADTTLAEAEIRRFLHQERRASIQFRAQMPHVPGVTRFGVASGGYISGPGTSTSDSIPAWLSDGEYVVKAAAVARYGRAFFDSVNTMRFATGGPVGRVAATAPTTSAPAGISMGDVTLVAADPREAFKEWDAGLRRKMAGRAL